MEVIKVGMHSKSFWKLASSTLRTKLQFVGGRRISLALGSAGALGRVLSCARINAHQKAPATILKQVKICAPPTSRWMIN